MILRTISPNSLFQSHNLRTIWQHGVRLMQRGLEVNIFYLNAHGNWRKTRTISIDKGRPQNNRVTKHKLMNALVCHAHRFLFQNEMKKWMRIPLEIDSKWLWKNRKRNTPFWNKNTFIVTLLNDKERKMAFRLTTSNRNFYQTKRKVLFILASKWERKSQRTRNTWVKKSFQHSRDLENQMFCSHSAFIVRWINKHFRRWARQTTE